MPSSIVPIVSTRQYSIQPAEGLRYGNFDRVVYLPPMTSSSGQYSERSVSELNNQQIYKKVCEWFDTWKPWQQRLALCGISCRCTVRQLEILATTLEPVKHRDHLTASNQDYPFKSLASKTPVNQTRKTTGFVKKKNSKTIQKKSINCSPREYILKDSESSSTKSAEKAPTQDKAFNVNSLNNLAHAFSDNNNIIQSGSGSLADKLGVKVQNEPNKNPAFNINNIKSSTNQNKQSVICSSADLMSSARPLSVSPNQNLFQLNTTPIINGPRLSFDFLGTTLEFDISSVKNKNENANSIKKNQKADTVLSPVDTIEYFGKDKVSRLGHYQREDKNGKDVLGRSVDNLPTSLPQFYKHLKFWPITPTNGKQFSKAKRLELSINFQDQLHHIWMWMTDWEDYEKIALIKELMKSSSPEILSDLLHHINQKLEDDKDINILNDSLLLYIFSYLPPSDINTASQVCRRWRYLCTSDDLWILKCLEMGEYERIKNIPGLVLDAKASGMLVDWKLAYKELNTLVQIMKDSLLQHNTTQEDVIGRVLTEDNNDRSNIKSRRKYSIITELHLRRGTMSRIYKHEEIAVKKHAADNTSSDSDLSDDDVSAFMTEYTVLPPIGENSKSFDWCNSAKRHRRKSVHTSQQNIAVDTDSATASLSAHTKNNILLNGKKSKEEGEEDDKALDIRPPLNQSVDLLGKTHATSTLQWHKQDDEIEDNETVDKVAKLPVYAGDVKSVLRVRKLQGHMNGIICLMYDKRRLVTAGLDRTIRIWDIRSGRSIHKLYGHTGGIRCLYFDDDILTTGSWDTTVLIWNMHDYSQESVLIGHTDCVSCVQFDSNFIVTGSYDGSVRIWYRKIYTCKHIIRHDESVNCIALYSGTVFSSSADLKILWSDIETGECLKIFDEVQSAIISIVVQGSLLIGGDANGVIYFWNTDTGETEAAIQAHKEAILSLAYHKGRFLTASGDGTIKEWDLLSMTCVRLLQGHKGPVRNVKVCDKRIVSCSDDGTVRVWDLVLPK